MNLAEIKKLCRELNRKEPQRTNFYLVKYKYTGWVIEHPSRFVNTNYAALDMRLYTIGIIKLAEDYTVMEQKDYKLQTQKAVDMANRKALMEYNFKSKSDPSLAEPKPYELGDTIQISNGAYNRLLMSKVIENTLNSTVILEWAEGSFVEYCPISDCVELKLKNGKVLVQSVAMDSTYAMLKDVIKRVDLYLSEGE